MDKQLNEKQKIIDKLLGKIWNTRGDYAQKQVN